MNVDEAAALLGVTPQWLYRHAKELPFTCSLSRKCLRFSRAGILHWLKTRRS
ncbi:MAG: helix-turn-helix transcriptional regulator [Gemmatimonadales bacterium]